MYILYAIILFILVSFIYTTMMFLLFKSPNKITCGNKDICNKTLYISESRLGGRGVFAGKPFKKGDIVEVCPVIIDKRSLIDAKSNLINYTFSAGKDGDVENVAIAFGYGSLYNHSDSNNVRWQVDPGKKIITFEALRGINKDEELLVTYGNKYWETRSINKVD